MTKTRLLAALIMAPIAILSVLFVPTPILAALSAVLFLIALWEWLKLAEIDDTLARSVLLLCNAALMAALVWGSRSAQGGSFALLQLVVVIGVAWWLLAMVWMRHYHFASDHDSHARAFKLLAGTLVFWLAEAVAINMQSSGLSRFPNELFIALPYILTIVLTIARKSFNVPAKLGLPYRKEV